MRNPWLFGLIGWSEIGLSYFFSNSIIILLAPFLQPYLAIINILALPYSIWSVWFQKFRVKQWCMLCLIVQFLLWAIFVVDLISGVVAWPNFELTQLAIVASVYLLPLTILSLLLPSLVKARSVTSVTQMMNSLKMKDEVMGALIKSEKRYELDHSTSQVVFGNRNANLLISVVTNPMCGPCATLHTRIDSLLAQYADRVCIQYIFIHFQGDEKRQGVQRLIAAYQNNDVNNAHRIFNEWYDGNRNESEFVEKYDYDIQANPVMEEILKHDEFTEKNKIHATPTIFINGYALPNSYRIEDVISLDTSILN